MQGDIMEIAAIQWWRSKNWGKNETLKSKHNHLERVKGSISIQIACDAE